MNKKNLIILLIGILLLISGCTTKTALNSNDFYQKMINKGFTIDDKTATTTKYTIQKYLIATNSFNTYKLNYYEFDSEMSAQGFYAAKKEYMDATGAQANTEVNVGNFSKYAHIHKGKYRVISRVSNTIIWIETDNQYQEEIKTLLKDIGY